PIGRLFLLRQFRPEASRPRSSTKGPTRTAFYVGNPNPSSALMTQLSRTSLRTMKTRTRSICFSGPQTGVRAFQSHIRTWADLSTWFMITIGNSRSIFTWQILDWDLPEHARDRIQLMYEMAVTSEPAQGGLAPAPHELVQAA